MKNINNYILENLNKKPINVKSIKVDDLNKENEELFNSSNWDNEYKILDEFETIINMIDDLCRNNKAHGAVAICNYNLSTVKSKNIDFDSLEWKYDDFAMELINSLVTWDCDKYIIRLFHGHVELDCINSGSFTTWYIYGLSQDAAHYAAALYNGDDEEVQNLDFLYQPKMIVKIT